MILQKHISSNKYFYISLLVFFIVHLFLFNINVAEWGDSYRILRAAEFIKQGTYPESEKRPPLFPVLIAFNPLGFDTIFWSRTLVLLFSLSSFVIFYKYLLRYSITGKWLLWGLLAFLLNTVYLYWSIRVMADVVFSFFALYALYLAGSIKFSETLKGKICIAFIILLAILTRFEGYLLYAAIVSGLFLRRVVVLRSEYKTSKTVTRGFPHIVFLSIKHVIPLIIALTILLIPYLIWRNPFDSSYFEEPGRRIYDLKMVAIYFISILGMFGGLYAVPIILRQKSALTVLMKEPAMLVFLAVELLLILAWPAAIPRLFVPVIPFVLMALVIAVQSFYTLPNGFTNRLLIMLGTIYTVFVIGQYYLKQQFLIVDKLTFIVVIILHLFIAAALVRKSSVYFITLSLLTMAIWSMHTISIHTKIFISVKNAAEYVAANLEGRVGYNDVSSVSDWYINYASPKALEGFYYQTDDKKNLEYKTLMEKRLDYLLITNEHNTTMTLDLEKRPYLKELESFEYNVNGTKFFAKVVKVE